MVPIRLFRQLLILIASFYLLAACSSQPLLDSVQKVPLSEVLNGNRLLIADPSVKPATEPVVQSIPEPSLPDIDILAIDAAAKHFVDSFLPESEIRKGFDAYAIQHFVNAVFAPGMLGLQYNSSATYTAQETFEKGNGNCLSAALLLASMLRYAGNDVYFQEVMVAPNWDRLSDDNRYGDTSYKVTRHINIVSKLSSRSRVTYASNTEVGKSANTVTIDFNRTNAGIVNQRRAIRKTVKLTDKEVFAQYYNNLAVEFMAVGNKRDAFNYYRKALDLSPRDPSLWSNLGVLYRRYQHYGVAEAAFLQALRLDSNSYSAMNNLVSLYTAIGAEKEKQYYLATIQNWRNRNPYYRYVLAQEAFRQSRFNDAQRHLDFVIRALEYPDTYVLDFFAKVEHHLHDPAVEKRDI